MGKQNKGSSIEIRADQLAPRSIEAEEATLGSILLDPEAYLEVADMLTPEDFFLVRHGFIWAAMQRLAARRDPIDHLTVAQEIEQAGQLADIGGAAYIISLLNNTPSALNVEGYGNIVARMALRRRLTEAASEIARTAHSDETEIDEVVAKAERALDAATNTVEKSEATTARDRASRHYDQTTAIIKARAAGVEPPGSITTGLTALDRIIGRFKPGELTYIAARPGMGKSGMIKHIAVAMAKAKKPVLLVSFEMSEAEIDTRIISGLMGVPYEVVAEGRFTEETAAAYTRAIAEYSEWPLLVIDDVTKANPRALRRVVRKAVRQHGVMAVLVDYVQLMTADGDNRNEQVSEISRHFKLMAKEFDIPVIAAAQLNRGVEARQDKRPLLSDLRESGSLEQDADVVMFIYRESYYDEQTTVGNAAEIIVAKHRNGPTGTAEVAWVGERTDFFNMQRTTISMDDIDPLGDAKSNPPAPAQMDFQAAAGGDKEPSDD